MSEQAVYLAVRMCNRGTTFLEVCQDGEIVFSLPIEFDSCLLFLYTSSMNRVYACFVLIFLKSMK